MTTYAPSGRLLLALFDMVQGSESIELFSLAEAAGLNLYRTLSELDRLDRRGLVDGRRLRLTAAGLTVAVSLNRRAAAGTDQAQSQRTRRGRSTPVATVVRLLPAAGRQECQGSIDEVFERDLVA